jgi:hypothetical protein
MTTLVLKPIFPIRTRSSRTRRVTRQQRLRAIRSERWRAISITTGAVALTFFCVAAPIIDDPTGRLLALETTSTIPTSDVAGSDAWSGQAFEFTPTTLGPAIAAEMLAWADEDASAEEDGSIVTMPELEVRALPPAGDTEATPPG